MIVNIVMQFGEMKYFNVISSVLNRYFNSSVLMVFTVSFYLLASCNNKSSQQTHTLLFHEELTGRVFIVGPGLDSARCLAYGECDCCASHYLFFNDSIFIAIEYCLESDTYFKGTYSCNDNQVLFYANGQFVDKEYPIDEKMGSNNPEPEAYKIKPNKGKPINFKWLRFECKNTTSFITDETDSRFVTVDSENKFVELVQEIKNEGIWSALGMKQSITLNGQMVKLRMENSNNYIVDVNNPKEDPFVYYTDEHGRKLKGRIELVKPGFWGRKGTMILFLDSLTIWENETKQLTIEEYTTALRRIVQQLNKHGLIVELK